MVNMRSAIAKLSRIAGFIAAAVCLALCVVLICFWVRSYFTADVIHFQPVAAPEENASPLEGRPNRWHYQYHIASARGRVQVVRRNLGIGDETLSGITHPPPAGGVISLNKIDPAATSWQLAGVEYHHNQRLYRGPRPVQSWLWGFLTITVPYWLLTLLTAMPPAILFLKFIRGRKRRRRIAAGLCARCGYDMRASGLTCPECGLIRETKASDVRQQMIAGSDVNAQRN
jgi:hypothetical protein